jgi:cell wall-associated NlpC family hydrolase
VLRGVCRPDPGRARSVSPIRFAAAPCVAAVVLVTGLGLVIVGTFGAPAQGLTSACATAGPVQGLSDAQAAKARTVVAVASVRGGTRAALLALMVAITESDLLVLANPNDPAGAAYDHQGVGYDHDSLGLFQQRPGWGSAAQRMDPTASTNLFLDVLLATPGWSTNPASYVAQTVQRSAFTGNPSAANDYSTTFGGNYLAKQGEAAGILGLIQSGAEVVDCGGAGGDVVPASAGRHGLPADYRIPAASPQAVSAVSFDLAQLGKPYQWGAEGPDRFDCSGLTQAAWARAGVAISRTTYGQINDGVATDLARLASGDLVLTPGSDGTLAMPGHVGMYIGRGLVVAAPKTGDVVKVVTLTSFTQRGVSAYRHVG